LLEIKEKIPTSYDAFLAGWNISPTPPSNVTGLHHPSGDVKKYSIFSGTTVQSSYNEDPNTYHWEIPKWSVGTTEGGSSGSPLFDNNGLIVGHLHGGQAACYYLDGWDMYGALTYDWATGPRKNNQLQPFLSPKKKSISRLAGMFLNQARTIQENLPDTRTRRMGTM
jgi:lysyl endopeptidase